MRLPDPFRAEGEHLGIALPGARALFTTRRGGFSSGPYASLNLGRWTADDSATVERNRAAVQEQLGVRFAYGRQVHSAHVQRTRSAWSDATEPEEADGQATAVRSVAPMVVTADCLPIAVAGGGSVAMIHAGWRGLAAGIVAEGVEAVRELGSGDELVAAIGPGAGACCYEVSEDVHAIFASLGTGVRRGRRLDLKAIAWQQLGRAGVTRVHDAGLCTICSDPGRFFSHRRDGGVTGRQAGIAWLTPA